MAVFELDPLQLIAAPAQYGEKVPLINLSRSIASEMLLTPAAKAHALKNQNNVQNAPRAKSLKKNHIK